jgi:hypothetical protein
MLRISVHDKPQLVTFQIEGKLAAPFLQELEECWRNTIAEKHSPSFRVDLMGETFIDDAGKACLSEMYRQGAEFIATDCVTKDVVREILEDCSQTTAGEMTA